MTTLRLLLEALLKLFGYGEKIAEEIKEAKEEKAIQDGRELALEEMNAKTDDERRALLRKRHGLPPG